MYTRFKNLRGGPAEGRRESTPVRPRRRPDRARLLWAVAITVGVALIAPQAATAQAPIKASGTPVKIALINSEGGQTVSVPDTREGAQAAVKYANAELGGIAGHPIQLVVCNVLGTPDSTRSCGNRLADSDVKAVMFGQDGNSDQAIPIITKSGIPVFSGQGNSPLEINSDLAFSATPGLPGALATMAAYAKQKGWKRVGILVINVASALGAINQFGSKAFNRAKVNFTITPLTPGAADVTSSVVQALSKDPDALMVIPNDSLCIATMKAYAAVNARVPLVLGSNTCLGKSIEAAAPASVYHGATVITGQFVGKGDPESETYLRAMKRYQPSTDTTGIAQRGYAGVISIVRATKEIKGDVTAAKMAAAFRAARNIPLPLGAGNTFTCDGKAIPVLKSVCSGGMVIGQVQSGGGLKFVSKVDVSSLLR